MQKKAEKYIDYFTPEWAKYDVMEFLEDYRYPPVSFMEFCLSNDYLGL